MTSSMVTERIETELAHTLIDGIQYEPIGGSIYMRELQADGWRKDRFIDQLYKVTNKRRRTSTTLLDSAVERQFANTWMGVRTSSCL